jgi:hypothetical protein
VPNTWVPLGSGVEAETPNPRLRFARFAKTAGTRSL